jgi:hypothetical protein
MDSTTTTLIVTQSISFLALVISETLPFLPGPYQCIIHVILDFCGMVKLPKKDPVIVSSK